MSEPLSLNEWRELLAKLVSLRIGPPQEPHGVEFVAEGVEPVRRAPYASENGEHVADALVTTINFMTHQTDGPSPCEIEKCDLLFRLERIASRVPLPILQACVEQCERVAEPSPLERPCCTEDGPLPIFKGGRFTVTLQLLTENGVV